MTYIIAEPCIDIKDRSCVDVCPVDCIHEYERILVIDPEDALPDKWEPFVKINYAFPDAGVINTLVDEYATEHAVQNQPIS
jgi:hypothetical protein